MKNTELEIYHTYKTMKKSKEAIAILAQLNGCSESAIKEIVDRLSKEEELTSSSTKTFTKTTKTAKVVEESDIIQPMTLGTSEKAKKPRRKRITKKLELTIRDMLISGKDVDTILLECDLPLNDTEYRDRIKDIRTTLIASGKIKRKRPTAVTTSEPPFKPSQTRNTFNPPSEKTKEVIAKAKGRAEKAGYRGSLSQQEVLKMHEVEHISITTSQQTEPSSTTTSQQTEPPKKKGRPKKSQATTTSVSDKVLTSEPTLATETHASFDEIQDLYKDMVDYIEQSDKIYEKFNELVATAQQLSTEVKELKKKLEKYERMFKHV